MTDDRAWAPPSAHDQLLPGYRDAVLVARGGDSMVYRAHQVSVDRDVAIKVVDLDPALDDGEALARFRRELEITVRLGRQHPHIVTVLAVDTTTTGRPCLVMDFFERGSLHDRLRARGPLPVGEVMAAGSVVADALAFAHAQGVLHRDVKPQNVLVLPTSWVLADFGLARAIDAGHSASLERFSYRHASPQVLDGEKPTVADDVYSLGSTLFTLLDGRAPFAADDPDEDSALSYLRRARTEPARVLDRDDVPAGLRDVIATCLAKARADRYRSADELRAALDSLDERESRGWAPAAAPDVGVEVAAEPRADAPSPPEAVAEPVAEPIAEPVAEPVATSVFAHVARTADGSGSGSSDEATGLRPTEPAALEPPDRPPAPSRRRWLAVVGIVAVAAVVGVVVGLLQSGGSDTDDHAVATRSTAPPRTSSSAPVVAVPSVSITPSGPSGSPVFDPKLAPTAITLVRRNDRVELRWRLPQGNTSPVVVFLDGDSGRRAIATVAAGERSVTLTNLPSGTRCLRLATVTSTPAGDTVFGLSGRRCVS